MTDKILVTGATGFVGSAVARALAARGDDVRVLVRPGSDRRNLAEIAVTPVEGDLTDAASLARAVAGCRYLFHVAADYRIWVPDPAAMLRTNVAGTRALMLAAQAAGVERIVYCSSVAALGLHADGTPADETTPVAVEKIVGVYKQSKYQAEQAVLELVRTQGLPAVIVNPAAPVGPRDIKPTPTGAAGLTITAGSPCVRTSSSTACSAWYFDCLYTPTILSTTTGVVSSAGVPSACSPSAATLEQ